MDKAELQALQKPLKDRYCEDPTSALVTLRAEGQVDGAGIACSVATGRALVDAGLHPATGGTGALACSGDMLLESPGCRRRAERDCNSALVASSADLPGDLPVVLVFERRNGLALRNGEAEPSFGAMQRWERLRHDGRRLRHGDRFGDGAALRKAQREERWFDRRKPIEGAAQDTSGEIPERRSRLASCSTPTPGDTRTPGPTLPKGVQGRPSGHGPGEPLRPAYGSQVVRENSDLGKRVSTRCALTCSPPDTGRENPTHSGQPEAHRAQPGAVSDPLGATPNTRWSSACQLARSAAAPHAKVIWQCVWRALVPYVGFRVRGDR